MKNILLVIITVSLLFFSCKNDDDSTNENQSNSLVGVWRLVQVFIENGIEVTSECDAISTVEFKSDRRFENRIYSSFREISDAAPECVVFPLVGDFFIDGDILTQKFDNGNEDIVIRFEIVKDSLKYISPLNGNTTLIFVKN